MEWADVASSLLLGTACAGCDRPGRTWCAECLTELHDAVDPLVLPVSPTVVACCRYAGCVPSAIVGYKDRGILSLGEALGHVAAAGVVCLLDSVAPQADALLVPAPSTPRALRRRGFDHMWEVVRVAAATVGFPAQRVMISRSRRDQAGLALAERAGNVDGRIRTRHRGQRPVIVVDDVRTSGATLAACERALQDGGYPLVGHVVISSAI